MNILLTNDDGYKAEGISYLAQALGTDHNVVVVAPEEERSACSHKITVHEPIRSRRISDNVYSCSGTPADCVNLALVVGVAGFKPDVVISGINHGANLGTDVIFSGTAAGARQAAIKGVPGIGVSIPYPAKGDLFLYAGSFVNDNLSRFLDAWKKDSYFNINVPRIFEASPVVEITRAARTRYESGAQTFESPHGDSFHFYAGQMLDDGAAPGTDYNAVREGHISVSQFEINPVSVETKLQNMVW